MTTNVSLLFSTMTFSNASKSLDLTVSRQHHNQQVFPLPPVHSMDRSGDGAVCLHAKRVENTSYRVNPLLDLDLFKYLDYCMWLSIYILARGFAYV